MEVNLSPELQARLKQLAEQQGRDAESLVSEAVERLLRYDEWFVGQVEKGLAQVDHGEVLDHEEVGNRLDKFGNGLKANQKGRADKSTLPPEKITPSFGGAPSARAGSPRLATASAFSRGAIATAEDGSTIIFM